MPSKSHVAVPHTSSAWKILLWVAHFIGSPCRLCGYWCKITMLELFIGYLVKLVKDLEDIARSAKMTILKMEHFMKLNPLIKNIIFVVLILLTIGGIFSLLYPTAQAPNLISLSQLLTDINQDKVKKITTSGDTVEITYQDDKVSASMKESGRS